MFQVEFVPISKKEEISDERANQTITKIGRKNEKN